MRKKTAAQMRRLDPGNWIKNATRWTALTLLLPRTLLMAMRLQALATLVLVHLRTTFLFQVTHGA
jgi:hypothetical protein